MTEAIAKPLGMLLKTVYDGVIAMGLDFTHLSGYAIALIVTSIIFKCLLLPLTLKQTKSMKGMQQIQPQLQELQKKYKNDPQTLNMKSMELYKEHKVSPFGGCLPLLIQFPILIGFFNVLREPVKYVFHDQAVYDAINKSFFWVKDLNVPDAIMIIPLLAALTTYISSKMMNTSGGVQDEKAQATQRTMTIIMPIMIFFMGRSLSAGLALYWVIGNLFTVVQNLVINGPNKGGRK